MNGAATVWGAIAETLLRGSDDLRVVALSFAVVAVIVALLITAVLFVGGLSRSGGARARGLPGPERRSGTATAVVIVLSCLFFVVLSTGYLGSSEMCAMCHEASQESWSARTHASVACVRCHREPGPIGFLVGQVDFARWVAVTVAGGSRFPEGKQAATVSSRACLMCHDAVRTGTLTDGVITVRHEDFADWRCTECHNTVGHGQHVPVPSRPDMRLCLTCHDARQVSAECSICHVGDVSVAARRATPRTAAVKVAAPTGTDCRGCHETDTCNECHGVEMPHPPDWMPGHARPAFERPDVCWRCHQGPEYRDSGPHPYALCNQCHRYPGPHGPSAEWRRMHGAAAAKAPGAIGRTRCGLCHTNPRFCDLCHDGRQEEVDYR